MKIPFFLIPKAETAYVMESDTIRQALEKMEYYKYTCLSVLGDDGKYKYSLSSNDFLHYMKVNPKTTFYDTQSVYLSEIEPTIEVKPIDINDDIENLIQTFTVQDYTPVIDGSGIYIGEVSATDVIDYILGKFDWHKND